MGSFELQLDIDRPPSVVWSVLSDVSRTPEWYEAVQRVVPVVPAGDGRGPSYELVRSLPGGKAVNLVEVTESEPEERFSLTSRSGPTPFTYRYTLTPIPGGTRLVLDAEISAAGLPGPLSALGPVATRLFKNGMRTNLGALARMLEQ
ncbi:SRPBCC family protein [Mumia quercus]|uniref:SRPBCC family protein n=1 Tax=Mumia quercus TaxID=2976125 RepID=UPI0021CEEC05|nr:SRPBCC family protein [Mumia quercus]